MDAGSPSGARKGFWATLADKLGRFGDALDVTEATLLLEPRLRRVEQEIALLKAKIDRAAAE
jgi:hypothetical protein